MGTAACAERSVVGTQAKAGVVIVVPVEAPLLAEGTTLRVHLWNASQLAAVESNARCSVVHDPQTTSDEIRCPEGISFQQVTPEELDLPLPAAGAPLEVTSESVRPGERFRILVSGPSPDGCNTTSVDIQASASPGRTVLDAPAWQTTARACL